MTQSWAFFTYYTRDIDSFSRSGLIFEARSFWKEGMPVMADAVESEAENKHLQDSKAPWGFSILHPQILLSENEID